MVWNVAPSTTERLRRGLDILWAWKALPVRLRENLRGWTLGSRSRGKVRLANCYDELPGLTKSRLGLQRDMPSKPCQVMVPTDFQIRVNSMFIPAPNGSIELARLL